MENLENSPYPCSLLHTSHAFHSAMMDAAIPPTVEVISGIQLNPMNIPIMSTVTGSWLQTADSTNPDFWAKNLRDTVKFADAIQSLINEGFDLFLEVGPGQTLGTLAGQTAQASTDRDITCFPSMSHAQSDQSDTVALAEAIGRLWLEGVSPDWQAFNDADVRRTSLPTYPFQRKRHWIESGFDSQSAVGGERVTSRQITGPDNSGSNNLEQLIEAQLAVVAEQLKVLGK